MHMANFMYDVKIKKRRKTLQGSEKSDFKLCR